MTAVVLKIWGFFMLVLSIMIIIWISVMSCVCPAGRLACVTNVRHNTQTVQPDLFVPAMFIGTIDFYLFIPLSLTLPGGHRASAKQSLLASFSPTLFI